MYSGALTVHMPVRAAQRSSRGRSARAEVTLPSVDQRSSRASNCSEVLDAAIFKAIIGNADAHGKHFSLLHEAGEIAVAPLYDLVCALPVKIYRRDSPQKSRSLRHSKK